MVGVSSIALATTVVQKRTELNDRCIGTGRFGEIEAIQTNPRPMQYPLD